MNMPNNPNINRNPDGSYMDNKQILADMIANRLTDDVRELLKNKFAAKESDQEAIKATGFDPNAFSRWELGRWIRNSYGLWNEDNPHTMSPWVDNGSTPDSVFHPDNFSGAIIDRLEDHFAE
jgi:hypothetical protein